MPPSELESVARAAALAGGEELRRRFDADDTAAEYTANDVKAEADRAAEDRMVPVIRRAFPEHVVYAEERGEIGDRSSYRWIVDPLDGTNNYAAGLPTFATSVAVLHEDAPEVAVAYLPLTDELYIARAGEGIRYRGRAVETDRSMAVTESTVGLIAGREVPEDPALHAEYRRIGDDAADRVKRVIHSWAPTVHSGLFARGRMQGLIEYHPDVEEEAVTALFAKEAGGVRRRDGPLTVWASDDELASTLWEATTDARSQ